MWYMYLCWSTFLGKYLHFYLTNEFVNLLQLFTEALSKIVKLSIFSGCTFLHTCREESSIMVPTSSSLQSVYIYPGLLVSSTHTRCILLVTHEHVNEVTIRVTCDKVRKLKRPENTEFIFMTQSVI